MAITLVRVHRQPEVVELSPREYDVNVLLQVRSDSVMDNALRCLEACPPFGSRLDFTEIASPRLRLCKRAPQRDPMNLLWWMVRLEYKTKVPPELLKMMGGEENEGQENPNPTLRPPTISGGFRDRDRPLLKDLDGKPILNSAGDTFKDPLRTPYGNPVLTFTQNEKRMPTRRLRAYYRSLNNAPFLGWPKETVHLVSVNWSTAVWENEFVYYPVQYTFEFGEDLIDAEQVVDRGYREKPAAGNELKNIADKNGNRPTLELKLDGNGRKLVSADPTAVHYLKYRLFKRVDYNDLFPNGLPTAATDGPG